MGGGLIFFFHSLRMLESHALCTRLHKMKHSCNAQQLESQIALSPPPPARHVHFKECQYGFRRRRIVCVQLRSLRSLWK